MSKVSAVPNIASDVRSWLKNSRSDQYSIHLQEFEDVSPTGKKGYTIVVWARDLDCNLVAELRFKIMYPWLKIYRCFVMPKAGGQKLTCQMYMAAMAFATEDLQITMVKAKQQDPNLVHRFGFDEKGFLSLRTVEERDALQTIMENCIGVCAEVNKCFESRLSKSQVLIITDKINDLLWSKLEGLLPITLEGNPIDGQAFGLPVDKLESYKKLVEKGYRFPQVLFDVQKPLTPEVKEAAATAIVDAVRHWGGEAYVNKESDMGTYLESKMVKEKTCTNGQCHEHECKNGVCYDVYSLQVNM